MKYLTYILLLTLLVSACEDPVDITLDEGETLVAVDAWLNDIPDATQTIKITNSQPYFDSSFVAGVNAAEITITTSGGNIYPFMKADDNGTYTMDSTLSTAWIAEPIGTDFTFEMDLNGVSYTANSTKNRVPAIDSIMQEARIGEAFVEDGIYCNFFATDIPGPGDTYWVKTYKNGQYLNRPSELNIAFDSAFSDGADGLVFIQPIQELNNEVDEDRAQIPWLPGEVIRVELHSITNEAFYFMEVLRDQLLNSDNTIFAEPLANTNGNISGSDGKTVLGFFNVAATSVLEDTIR